jgi:hypothetical protein
MLVRKSPASRPGISITPSITACATCTPFGANSFAIESDRARKANFEEANVAMSGLALTEAVAPVKISVGGYLASESSACFSRRGKACCENRKAPFLTAEYVSNQENSI